jgi:hypothetical protein
MRLATQLLLCVPIVAGLPTAALLFSLPLGSAPDCGASALCSLWPASSGSVEGACSSRGSLAGGEGRCAAGTVAVAAHGTFTVWEGDVRGISTAALRARTRGTSASTAVRHLE